MVCRADHLVLPSIAHRDVGELPTDAAQESHPAGRGPATACAHGGSRVVSDLRLARACVFGSVQIRYPMFFWSSPSQHRLPSGSRHCSDARTMKRERMPVTMKYGEADDTLKVNTRRCTTIQFTYEDKYSLVRYEQRADRSCTMNGLWIFGSKKAQMKPY